MGLGEDKATQALGLRWRDPHLQTGLFLSLATREPSPPRPLSPDQQVCVSQALRRSPPRARPLPLKACWPPARLRWPAESRACTAAPLPNPRLLCVSVDDSSTKVDLKEPYEPDASPL